MYMEKVQSGWESKYDSSSDQPKTMQCMKVSKKRPTHLSFLPSFLSTLTTTYFVLRCNLRLSEGNHSHEILRKSFNILLDSFLQLHPSIHPTNQIISFINWHFICRKEKTTSYNKALWNMFLFIRILHLNINLARNE